MVSSKIAIIFIASLSWSFCAANKKYCELCKDHTMCLYTGIGAECKKGGESGISDSDKRVIVDVHNRLRRMVATGKEKRGKSGGQPKAANLRKFVWDEELAKVAQRWANQCRFGHDTCRKDRRWYVGQNIYWKSQSRLKPINWTDAIMFWYEEVEKFDSKHIDKYSLDPETGHYTQLLWAETYAIGCGRKDYGQNRLCVCNYGPGGNFIGDKLYIKGDPCSKCPSGTTCDDALCESSGGSHRSGNFTEDDGNWRNLHDAIRDSKLVKDIKKKENGKASEKTMVEVKEILQQIEKLLTKFVESSASQGKEEVKTRQDLENFSEYMQTNVFPRLFNDQ